MTLSATVGLTGNDRRVLVPFVDCWAKGSFGVDNVEELHTVRLSMDNVAFVIERLAEGVEQDCVPWLRSMSSPELAPPEERVAYMVDLLDSASRRLANAAAQLREMGSPATASEQDAT